MTKTLDRLLILAAFVACALALTGCHRVPICRCNHVPSKPSPGVDSTLQGIAGSSSYYLPRPQQGGGPNIHPPVELNQ